MVTGSGMIKEDDTKTETGANPGATKDFSLFGHVKKDAAPVEDSGQHDALMGMSSEYRDAYTSFLDKIPGGPETVPGDTRSRAEIARDNKKNRSEFTRGLISGIDDTQGLLYGATSLVGSAVGSDKLRNWGFEGYKRNLKEAELNPLSVSRVQDINSIEDAGDWFAGVIGKLAPTMADITASALIGTAVVGPAGTVTGAFSRGIIKKVVAKKVAKAMESAAIKKIALESGEAVAKQAAEKAVIRQIGGSIGTVLGSAALEGGGMFGDDATKHGIDKANPYSAAVFGLASGATEIFAPSGQFVRRILGTSTVMKLTKDQAKQFIKKAGTGSFIKSMVKAAPGAMAKEGAQEFAQEFISTLNEFVNDPGEGLLTAANFDKYINAAAAGAAAGVLFGLGEGGFKYKSDKQEALERVALDEHGQDDGGDDGSDGGGTGDGPAGVDPDPGSSLDTGGKKKKKPASTSTNAVADTEDVQGAPENVYSGEELDEIIKASEKRLKNLNSFKKPTEDQKAVKARLEAEIAALSGGKEETVLDLDQAAAVEAEEIEGKAQQSESMGEEPPMKDPSQKEFIDKKVTELGSVAAVDEKYKQDSPVAKYAKWKAREVYGNEPKTESVESLNPKDSVSGKEEVSETPVSEEEFNKTLSSQSHNPEGKLNKYLFTEDTPENVENILNGKSGHPRNLVYWQQGRLHHNSPNKSVIVIDKSKIDPSKLQTERDDVGEYLIDAKDIKDAVVGSYKHQYELREKGYTELFGSKQKDPLKTEEMSDSVNSKTPTQTGFAEPQEDKSLKEIEDEISKDMLEKASTHPGNYNGKPLKDLAVDIAQDAIDTRSRMTKEKRIALAEKHGVPENVVHQMTTGGQGYEMLAGRSERGDKEASAFLNAKKQQRSPKPAEPENKRTESREERARRNLELVEEIHALEDSMTDDPKQREEIRAKIADITVDRGEELHSPGWFSKVRDDRQYLKDIKAKNPDFTHETRMGIKSHSFKQNQQVDTVSGKKTTAYPKTDFTTQQKARNSEKRIDQWLIDNATAEAESRGDSMNARIFKNNNVKNLSPASRADMEMYLFEYQPDVPKPITKPLSDKKMDKSENVTDKPKKSTKKAENVTEKPEKEPSSVKDQLKAEWAKQAAERQHKEEMAAAAEKAKESAGKMMDAFKNINSILGDRGSFSTEKIDEDIYQQIKEQLNLAWGHAKDTGKAISEFVSIAMDALSPKATPYFNRWVDEEISDSYTESKEKETANGTESDTATTSKNEAVTDSTADSESGSVLGKPSDVAPGQSTAMDDGVLHPGEQENDQGPADKGDTDSNPAEGDQESGGEAGTGPDRGSDNESDSGTTGKPGTATGESTGTSGSTEITDTGLEPKPAPKLKPADQNHVIGPRAVLFPKGPETKIKANIAAIRLLKKLEKADRNPSPKEKVILAQYVGWGAFSEKVFKRQFADFHKPNNNGRDPEQWLWGSNLEKYKNWKEKYGSVLHPGLGGLMTEEEWASAAASTLNAHYTSKEVVQSVWDLIERLGFKGGHVLEPSAGVGHFFGMTPAEIAKASAFHGVEMDSLSGRILGKLYPEAHIQVTGFEKARGFSNNSMDLVVSNFPFGNYSVLDKNYKQYSDWSIHNYFFGKSIDMVRPGGLVVGITSHFTMDAISNGKIRKTLGEKADFIGAIRLPKTAFKQDAGTEVVTDIIIFRKKDGTEQIGERFRTADNMAIGDEQSPVNEYFVANPDKVLGKHSMTGSMRGQNEYTVEPTSKNLKAQIDKAIESFPENIIGEGKAQELQKEIYSSETAKEGTLILDKGKIYYVDNGKLVQPTLINTAGKTVPALNSPARIERATAYLDMRNATENIVSRMQEEGVSDEEIAKDRTALNKMYDAFVKKFGRINSPGNSFLRRIDNDFPILDALENEDSEISNTGKQTKVYSKADILKKRTVFPFKEPASADNVKDALLISLVYRNHIDVEYISSLTGMHKDLVKKELIEKEHAYLDPESGMLVTPDKYLSGNVKKKLKAAEQAAKSNKDLARNVAALKAAQPDDIDIEFVFFKLGSTWIPEAPIQDFINHLVGIPVTVQQIRTEENSNWLLKQVQRGATTVRNTETWGVDGASALKLINDSLNLRRTKVFDVYYDEHNKRRTVENKEKSLVAQKKQEEIQNEFRSWARSHKEWSGQMSEIYNQEYNGFVTRKFEAPPIDHFPGANKDITLRPLQKQAVFRCLQESALLSYGVGTGKTFTFVSLAMEMRRLKTARKPLLVVQGSTIQQFAKAFKVLYPQSKVLIPGDAQRSGKNRKKLLSQITTGDWDAVVIPHSFFDRIADDPAREAALIQEQLAELEEAMDAAREADGANSPTVKQMEAAKKRKEKRLQKLQDRSTDDTITFEKMGIDALLVDEAHNYKRAEFSTKMGNIKGIDNDASQRSSSLILKSNFIREKTNNKNIILATGTPISNTTAELWTMIRYVRPELLKEYGVSMFDDFAANFGDTTITTEETDTGDFKEVERFNKFVNGPELITLFHSASDVVLTKNAGLDLPSVKGGKAQMVAVKKSQDLTDYITELRALRESFENMSGREKMENRHIPLVVYTRAKKAAIDMQLIDPVEYKDDPTSKLSVTSNNVFRIWKDNKKERSTQVVFLDTYQDSTRKFNAYHHIKNKLVALGVPANEIVIISDANNDSQKEAMFQRVRTGDARVIIGSTTKLGIGVNMQDKLIAAHHVDVVQRPMDIEQRNGRIIREGNENKEVQIYNYGVIDTLDSVMYDRLVKKQKFIDQMLNGDIQGREFDDPLGDEQISFAEMNAAFAGNPLLFEKSDTNIKVKELEILKHSFIRDVSNAKRNIRMLEHDLENMAKDLEESIEQKEIADKDFKKDEPITYEVDGEVLPQKQFVKNLGTLFQEQREKLRGIYVNLSKKQVEKKVLDEVGRYKLEAKMNNGYTVTIETKVDDSILYPWWYNKQGKLDGGEESNLDILDLNINITSPDKRQFIHFTSAQFTRSLNQALQGKRERPDRIKAAQVQAKEDIVELQSVADRVFEKEDELNAQREKFDKINEALEAGFTSIEDHEKALSGAAEKRVNKGVAAFSQQKFDDVRLGERLYSTGDTLPGQGVSVKDIQAAFPGQTVGISPDSSIWIRMKNGRGVKVSIVKDLGKGDYEFAMQTGRLDEGGIILGKYIDHTITLNKDYASKLTVWHEVEHLLEDMGLVTQSDQIVMNGKINAWSKQKRDNGDPRLDFALNKDMRENRANFLAQVLNEREKYQGTALGRILQKIADFFDGVLNIGRSSVRKIARGIESGKVYEKPVDGKSETKSPQYSTTAAEDDYLPPEVRKRVKAAKGIGATSLLDKAAALFKKFKEQTAHFPGLTRITNIAEKAFLKEKLRQFQEIPPRAQDEALRLMKNTISGLSKVEYKAFTMRVILGDEVESIKSGLRTDTNLPFGFKNKKELLDSFDKLTEKINTSLPNVKKAIETRQGIHRKVAKGLVAHGLLKKEVLDSNEYFHHQILLYWRDKEAEFKGIGTSSKDTRTHWRPWMAARKGSPLDYNTEYFEAELVSLAQQLSQLYTAKALKEIKTRSDITQKLKAEAKAINHKAMMRILDEQGMLDIDPLTGETKDPLNPFKAKMAIGISNLVKLAGKGTLEYDSEFQDVIDNMVKVYDSRLKDVPDVLLNFPKFFHFLSHTIGSGTNGSGYAAMIFKGIQDRNKFIKDVVGDQFKKAGDIIPEGYVEWEPDKGKGWFYVNSVSDQVLAEVARGDRAPTDIEVRQVLAKGQTVKWIVPEGLADTMNNFRPVINPDFLSSSSRRLMNLWKQYILLNPLSFIRYNLNNMSGDLDVVLAYNPAIAKPAAMKSGFRDVRAWMRNKKGVPADMKIAMDKGVLNSGFSVQEVEDTLKILSADKLVDQVLLEKRAGLAVKYFARARHLTTFRENILRLNSFRWFRKELKAGRQVYGASQISEIDALMAEGLVDDAAAKMARELLGDYGAISRHGEFIRAQMMPFYSWMEINLPRYVYLLRNARHENGSKSGGTVRIAGTAVKKTGLFAMKASMLYAAVSLFNGLVWPEEEEELGASGRRQMHLILGRREDGSIITMRFQGALSDALSWFGLEDFPFDVQDVIKGKATLLDKMEEVPKALLNRSLQGIRPDVKVGFEVLTGKQLYPDVLTPRPIRDKVEHVLRTFKMDIPYRWGTGRGHRGDNIVSQIANELASVAVYTTEPGMQSYYDMRRMVFDWQEKNNIEKSFGNPTSKGNALYYYKEALRYGDIPAAKRFLKKYGQLGGTVKGLKQSVKMSHPLTGIPTVKRNQFLRKLTSRERSTYKRGLRWYKMIYLNQRGHK